MLTFPHNQIDVNNAYSAGILRMKASAASLDSGLPDPNCNAVLHEPTKPVNEHMNVMENTAAARLYHSEAIVHLDGRVMVSGFEVK